MNTLTRISAAFLLAAAATGCQRSTVREPLAIDGVDASDPAKQLDFWHSLPGRSAVSNNEGLHGLILFVDGQDPNTNYEQRVAYAKEKGWLAQGFNEPGEMVMQRGTLARAIAVSNNIKGGVMMRVTNSAGRYAARELQYLRIMGDGTEQQVLSGLDYVGVISKVQDYMAVEAARAETGKPTSRIRPVPPREENSNMGGDASSPSGAAPAPAESPTAAPEPPAQEPEASKPQ